MSSDVMPISLKDALAKLSDDERAAVAARAEKLVAEEANLRELREARSRSQVEIGRRLGVNQAAVSKLERRADMYVSTLRNYVESMGGELTIIARFPDRDPIEITQFTAMKAKPSDQPTR
jgi:hypothetical protein